MLGSRMEQFMAQQLPYQPNIDTSTRTLPGQSFINLNGIKSTPYLLPAKKQSTVLPLNSEHGINGILEAFGDNGAVSGGDVKRLKFSYHVDKAGVRRKYDNEYCLTCQKQKRACPGFDEALGGCRVCRMPNISKGEKFRKCVWAIPEKETLTYKEAHADFQLNKQGQQTKGKVALQSGHSACGKSSKCSAAATKKHPEVEHSSPPASPRVISLPIPPISRSTSCQSTYGQSGNETDLNPIPNSGGPQPGFKVICKPSRNPSFETQMFTSTNLEADGHIEGVNQLSFPDDQTRANIVQLPPPMAPSKLQYQLKPLDKSGRPCRKWKLVRSELKSVTGFTWERPSWRCNKESEHAEFDHYNDNSNDETDGSESDDIDEEMDVCTSLNSFKKHADHHRCSSASCIWSLR